MNDLGTEGRMMKHTANNFIDKIDKIVEEMRTVLF